MPYLDIVIKILGWCALIVILIVVLVVIVVILAIATFLAWDTFQKSRNDRHGYAFRDRDNRHPEPDSAFTKNRDKLVSEVIKRGQQEYRKKHPPDNP